MITPSLAHVATAAGLTLSQARKFMLAMALLPRTEGDELLAGARREAIRELAAERRSRR